MSRLTTSIKRFFHLEIKCQIPHEILKLEENAWHHDNETWHPLKFNIFNLLLHFSIACHLHSETEDVDQRV